MTATAVREQPNAEPVEPPSSGAAWRLVAAQECRELWLGGRGPALLLGYGLLLSVVTYLAGSNATLNFLEQRESVHLVLQTGVAVAMLLTLVVSADAISGERERGTLESLLLAPVPRRALVLGKLAAALTVWLACFVVALPYLWALGRGVDTAALAMALGLAVGTLLAVGIASFGLLVSGVSGTNRVSLSVSFLVLLALFAPTQLPSGLLRLGWFGELLDRLNPIASGLKYLTAVLVNDRGWTRDLSYLASPALTAVLAGGLLVLLAGRLVRLHPGGEG